MPNEIDDLIAEVSAGKQTEKGPYQPAKGEEAIFAAPEKGLLDYLAPLLPFYKQFTGQTPWRSPETAVEAGMWGTGFLNPAGIGQKVGGSLLARTLRSANPLREAESFLPEGYGNMPKAITQKGPSAITKALEDIFAKFGGKRGGLPVIAERGFTHRPRPEDITSPEVAERLQQAIRDLRPKLGITEPKQLPQHAGPTAPRGIPRPRITRILADRIQDTIDDLMRESLKAKGIID